MSSYRASDILHENGKFFVIRKRGEKGWFDVLRNDGTHATHRSTFHFSHKPDEALRMAISDCDRRASGQHWAGAKA